jgi:hypothetical protein
MTPILGIIASQISGHLASPSSYESIATVTVGAGGSSSISFSSISSSYKHLQIRAIGRDAGANGEYKMEFNGDTTTTNYYLHNLYGDGATANASKANNNTVAPLVYSGQTANAFEAIITDILDYANTSKNKVSRTLAGKDLNGSGFIGLYSNLWNNTAAVNSIVLKVVGGTNFAEFTQFALYGVKG